MMSVPEVHQFGQASRVFLGGCPFGLNLHFGTDEPFPCKSFGFGLESLLHSLAASSSWLDIYLPSVFDRFNCHDYVFRRYATSFLTWLLSYRVGRNTNPICLDALFSDLHRSVAAWARVFVLSPMVDYLAR